MREKDVKELVEVLEGMYDQYCDGGHQFMTAGEQAEIVLQQYGFEFDPAGRITSRPSEK